MQKFKSVEELVNQLRPNKPVYCIRKNSILSASRFFQKNFPGDILYAVKTNPHSEVIKTLIKSGISQFDVASIEEIKAVKKFSRSTKCSFMHTVKSSKSIFPFLGNSHAINSMYLITSSSTIISSNFKTGSENYAINFIFFAF